MISVTRYTSDHKSNWDKFVARSRNGTFLFRRDYMEYHADRFDDHSLIILRKGSPLAVVPANEDDRSFCSHQGLTYGGFVVGDRMTSALMIEALAAVVQYLGKQGFQSLEYKTIPHIYHRRPAQDDLYAFAHRGLVPTRRDVLSVLVPAQDRSVQKRRQRATARALRRGFNIAESDRWEEYWEILWERLVKRYGVEPVHTLKEITSLADNFPNNIRLFVCLDGKDVVAGTVVYDTGPVAHAQYIAANDVGLADGALDYLFDWLVVKRFASKPFFDFGSSFDPGSNGLNEGLIDQKEGLGARTVVHDYYSIEI